MRSNVVDSQMRLDGLPASVYQIIKEGFVTTPKKELKATRLFYVNTDYPEYVKNITWEKYTAEGEAAIVAEGSKDIPLINDFVEDVTTKVVTIKQGLVISDLEKKAIAAGQQKFNVNRVSEIRYKINQLIDRIIFRGDAKAKIVGIAGLKGTKEYTFKKSIKAMTGFELLEELRAIKVKTDEDNIWMANMLLVPQSYWGYFTKGISEQNPRTVLSYVREEALFDVIEPISDLDAIKGGREPMMIALDADKSNLEIAMVMAPKQISEHMDTADNTQINFGARTAGLLVYHEQAITYIKQLG
jgi:hypothetical protein